MQPTLYKLMEPIRRHRKHASQPYLYVIGLAMMEHVQKHNEHHDGAPLTPSDRSHRHVASTAHGLKVKWCVELLLSGFNFLQIRGCFFWEYFFFSTDLVFFGVDFQWRTNKWLLSRLMSKPIAHGDSPTSRENAQDSDTCKKTRGSIGKGNEIRGEVLKKAGV